ncbi:alpha/beta hydrolase [Aestuariivita sp.]|jgi:acetyl esterase/lipase|uniref:alpha/beta hydrolase n=1 Tax=Aestuariivita sp. TaxID=1872407 RepID=UPI00216E058F|nr:alpha/beta hydrolase [Aestuariivita sp.]MCE8006276.1 alpha/beta hydrolase [Aestuariivita sp.]
MRLDDAYANGAYIPHAAEYPRRWAAKAEALRTDLGARAEIALRYGRAEREVFDLFHPQGVAKGTVIFVHGGYWKAFDRSSWSHLAAGPLARGWAVAIPSYTLCPDIRIAGITPQIVAAVTAIADRTEGPLALTGHSAGGHLVARMLAPGMLSTSVAARIACVVPISPLADLGPLLETSMNTDLRMDAAEARAESPIHQPVPETPVAVWVGGAERPAFLDQAQLLAEAWQAPCHIAEGRHHFDVIDALEQPDSDLTRLLTRS